VVDGRQLKVPGREKGFFLGGCLFDQVQPFMRIYQEEIFGPVLSWCACRTSRPRSILSTRTSSATAWRCSPPTATPRASSRRIQIGMVGINVPIPVPMAFYSFGGWKKSLFGDTHAYGMEGVRFYTRYKAVMQRWPGSIAKGAEFIMPTAK
jgi:malonate-semialdehyde dehydrogenase (acetylating) / methylmalonate-semialdehyde dehydrogenase